MSVGKSFQSRIYGREEIGLIEAFSLRNDTGEIKRVRRLEIVIGGGVEGRKTRREVH